MSTQSNFDMTVVEKFNFRDGRMVFVGSIVGNSKIIKPGKCELIVKGTKIATIWIEGEMIAEHRKTSKYRAVSTKDSTCLKDIPFVSGEWQLVCNC